MSLIGKAILHSYIAMAVFFPLNHFTTVDTAAVVDTELKSLKAGPANIYTELIFLFHSDRSVVDLNMLCAHVRISVALVRKVAESQAKLEYVEFNPFIGVIFMNRTGRATLSILAGLNTPGPTHRSGTGTTETTHA